MRSDKKNPLISVILPVYNCERYVSQAIESILNQSFSYFELLIADDGSKDKSRKIIDDYAARDPRIIISHNKTNQGKVRTVNRLFKMCRGEYITIHDSDDWSEKTMFENFIEFFRDHPDYVLAGSSYNNITNTGALHSVSHMVNKYEEIRKNIGIINKVHGPTIVFKKGIPEKVYGLFREIKMGEDIDFIWRVGEQFKITNISEVLYNYRIHSKSMTKYFKHDIISKIRDRKVIYSLAQQRKKTGTDVLIQNDSLAFDRLLHQIESEYKEKSFVYINEYASYLIWHKMKLNAIKFIVYNIFKEGISIKKMELLIYTILFK